MDMMAKHKIAVILPAFNEEQTIGEVIKGVKKSLPGAQIVVIIDKSTDRTVQIARHLGARVIRLPLKMGMGCAIQAGLKYAYRKGYEFVVRMDSDGQHIPEGIAGLLLPVLNKEADLTVGSRYLNDNRYRAPVLRRGVMAMMAWIVSVVYGRKFTDTTSGFKAMNRKALGFLANNYPTIGGTPTLILLKNSGFKVIEVGVHMKERDTGKSYFTFVRKVAYVSRVFIELLALMLRKKNRVAEEAEI